MAKSGVSGCRGVEVSFVKDGYLYGPNLASAYLIDRQFHRLQLSAPFVPHQNRALDLLSTISISQLFVLEEICQRNDKSNKGITQDSLRPAQPLRSTKDKEGIFCDHRSSGLAEFRDPLITLALCFALCQSRNFLRYWGTGGMLGPTDTTPKYGVPTVSIGISQGAAL